MIICVISVVVVVIIAFITVSRIYNGDFFFLAPGYSKMDRHLKANINELSHVVDALSELDYDSIEIRKPLSREEEKDSMIVRTKNFFQDGSFNFDCDTIPIPDELLGSVEILYKSGVQVISCGRNSVDFTMWSVMDESRGIIYSRTGKKPDGEQLTEVRQLSKENWYYYVHNLKKRKRVTLIFSNNTTARFKSESGGSLCTYATYFLSHCSNSSSDISPVSALSRMACASFDHA